MEWYWSIALILGALFTLLFVGVPVVFAFFAVNIVGMFLLMGGEAGLEQMVNSAYGSLTVFVLLPITLFVLMGEVMFRAGVAARMIDALDKWLGNLPGRLSLLAVASGTVLASLSGASIGTTAMLGATLAPELESRGYKKPMSIGPLLGSGGLAIMIPPSGLGVILAVLAEVSVGKLLIAIVLPGILMAVLYASYIIVRCYLQPDLAPRYAIERVPLGLKISLTRQIRPAARAHRVPRRRADLSRRRHADRSGGARHRRLIRPRRLLWRAQPEGHARGDREHAANFGDGADHPRRRPGLFPGARVHRREPVSRAMGRRAPGGAAGAHRHDAVRDPDPRRLHLGRAPDVDHPCRSSCPW